MEATLSPPPAALSVEKARWTPAQEAEHWTRVESARWAGWQLAAALCPVLAVHPLLPRPRWVAPWELLKFGPGLGIFFLLPLVGAALVWGTRNSRRLKARCLALITIGLISLVTLALVPFDERVIVYRLGALFGPAPPKLLLLAGAVFGVIAVASNRVRKRFPYSALTRGLPLAACLAMLAAIRWPSYGDSTILGALWRPQEWERTWPLLVLASMGLLYTSIAAANLFPHRYSHRLSQTLSLLARAALVWTPIALFLERQNVASVGQVIGASTRTPDLVATVKLALTLYGPLFLMSTGVAGWLAKHEWDRVARRERLAAAARR